MQEEYSLCKENPSREMQSFSGDQTEGRRKDFKCKSGCEKYSSCVDEELEYAEKNKNAIVRLKSVAEYQKKKLSLQGRKNKNVGATGPSGG